MIAFRLLLQAFALTFIVWSLLDYLFGKPLMHSVRTRPRFYVCVCMGTFLFWYWVK